MAFDIWNNLDEIGLYLGLDRLDSETDEDFYKRIKLFGRWRYKTDYYNLSHSIPLQAGLSTEQILQINSTGKYICKIDWEYIYLSNDIENIRVFIGTRGCKLSKILDAIDSSETFTYILFDEQNRDLDCKFIIRNSNIKRLRQYIPYNKYLLKKNIIENSLMSENDLLLINKKQSLQDLKRIGDYFIDYETGYIELFYPDYSGEFFNYQYIDSSFFIEKTDINLIPLNIKAKYGITDSLIDLSSYILNSKVWGS